MAKYIRRRPCRPTRSMPPSAFSTFACPVLGQVDIAVIGNRWQSTSVGVLVAQQALSRETPAPHGHSAREPWFPPCRRVPNSSGHGPFGVDRRVHCLGKHLRRTVIRRESLGFHHAVEYPIPAGMGPGRAGPADRRTWLSQRRWGRWGWRQRRAAVRCRRSRWAAGRAGRGRRTGGRGFLNDGGVGGAGGNAGLLFGAGGAGGASSKRLPPAARPMWWRPRIDESRRHRRSRRRPTIGHSLAAHHRRGCRRPPGLCGGAPASMSPDDTDVQGGALSSASAVISATRPGNAARTTGVVEHIAGGRDRQNAPAPGR